MTNITQRRGGSSTQSQFIVSADQVTVLGSGTDLDPIRLASSALSTLDASFIPSLPLSPTVGAAVAIIPEDPGAGAETSVEPASAASSGRPVVIGLILAIVDPSGIPIVRVQKSGLFTLTESEWDAITGEGGGLTPGRPYYQSDATLGAITQDPPGASGSFVSQVGIAVSTTVLALSTSSVAIQNP